MDKAIRNFNTQFSYEPEIKNREVLAQKSSFVVVGMGGSALAAELLKTVRPDIDITLQRDYGLSGVQHLTVKAFENKLIILSSYSGNTEEVIDAFHKGKDLNLSMAVIAVGGELLRLAIENKIPYIQLPETGIQPRSALGFSVKAFLKIIGEEEELKKISGLERILNPAGLEEAGKKLAEKLRGFVPVVYASNRNLSVAYNWKIKMNETGKIPAFYNVLPELNHNEMTGFDLKDSSRALSDKFYFIILKDEADDKRITKRMEVLEKLYKDRNLKVEALELAGENIWQKIFSSLVLADWAAYYTALQYGLEPEKVPMVEEFKKLISGVQHPTIIQDSRPRG